MTITFCGHSEIYDEGKVKHWLMKVTEDLILNGAKIFYLGGYGSFDGLVKSVLIKHKKEYTHIELILVIPYINHKLSVEGYDCTLYPPLETTPRRLAIIKRNEWMVEQSDIVVAYVTHNWGGAAATLNYANRKRKKVINYTTRG